MAIAVLEGITRRIRHRVGRHDDPGPEIDIRQRNYNHGRPHQSLGRKSPAMLAQERRFDSSPATNFPKSTSYNDNRVGEIASREFFPGRFRGSIAKYWTISLNNLPASPATLSKRTIPRGNFA